MDSSAEWLATWEIQLELNWFPCFVDYKWSEAGVLDVSAGIGYLAGGFGSK